LVDKFSNLAVEKGLSLRDVTNLLFRNILKNDGLERSINQIDEFVREKLIMKEAKSREVTDNDESQQNNERSRGRDRGRGNDRFRRVIY
jgi:hypothetical protein